MCFRRAMSGGGFRLEQRSIYKRAATRLILSRGPTTSGPTLTGCFVLGTTSAAICKGRTGTIEAGDVLDVVRILCGIHRGRNIHSVGVVLLVGRVRGRSEGIGDREEASEPGALSSTKCCRKCRCVPRRQSVVEGIPDVVVPANELSLLGYSGNGKSVGDLSSGPPACCTDTGCPLRIADVQGRR